VEGDGESLSVSVGYGEFAHKEIGIEQEDNEGDFDDGSQDRDSASTI